MNVPNDKNLLCIQHSFYHQVLTSGDCNNAGNKYVFGVKLGTFDIYQYSLTLPIEIGPSNKEVY